MTWSKTTRQRYCPDKLHPESITDIQPGVGLWLSEIIYNIIYNVHIYKHSVWSWHVRKVSCPVTARSWAHRCVSQMNKNYAFPINEFWNAYGWTNGLTLFTSLLLSENITIQSEGGKSAEKQQRAEPGRRAEKVTFASQVVKAPGHLYSQNSRGVSQALWDFSWPRKLVQMWYHRLQSPKLLLNRRLWQ